MKTIHIIAGPTASGKSALAMELAVRENGVVINADSMQVYDGLPILAAQPSAADRLAIPHLLYGVRDPALPSSAGNWRDMAIEAITQTLADNKTPIVTGGSGLYIKALIEGFSPIPDVPDEIRACAIARQKELGNPAFYEELKKRDPVMAARHHPSHTSRLVRAWEILEATGRSLAEWQALPSIPPPEDWIFDVTLVMPDREVLNVRAAKRFEAMLAGGVLEEVRDFDRLLAGGQVPKSSLLTRALGFRPLRDHLHGRLTLAQATEKSVIETRQYAKRQATWFRHQMKPQKNIASVRTLT